jgi:hypothetical protein
MNCDCLEIRVRQHSCVSHFLFVSNNCVYTTNTHISNLSYFTHTIDGFGSLGGPTLGAAGVAVAGR